MPNNYTNPPPSPPPPPPSTVGPDITISWTPFNNTGIGTSSSSGNSSSTYTRFFIIAVVCLCFISSLVLVLHLYLRYIRTRHAQRHRRQSVNLLRLTAFTHAHSDSPRAGLDRAAISSIPSFQYQKEAHSNENSTTTTAGADDCAVCLSLLQEGEVVRMLPACRHVFHVACIDKWLTSSASCPVCRAEVRPLARMQGRTQPAVVDQATDAPAQEQNGVKEEAEAGGSVSTRLSSSFRRMLSGDRSSRRVQDEAVVEDLERGNGANPNN